MRKAFLSAVFLTFTLPAFGQAAEFRGVVRNAEGHAEAGKTVTENRCFQGVRPWIDVTCYKASGSGLSTTASCVAGVSNLTLASAIDFVNGEGLSILGCGAAPTVTVPNVSVANIGTAGSTTYSYAVATMDAGGGNSGYGTLVSTSTGNATLSGMNYNAIYITPVSGARGYTLVGRSSGSPTVLQYMPWEDSTSYTATASRTNNVVMVTVTGPTTTLSFFATWYVTLSTCSDTSFNGIFQVTSTGMNTFNYSQTASNSSATGCTVTVNPTFFDFGTTYPLPHNLSVSSTTTNDIFTATITSGGGTTSVSLSTAPTVNASGQTVRHDDTAAWKTVIAQVAALNNSTPIYCPSGTYPISSDLNIPSGFNVLGAGYGIIVPSCTISQLNPSADIFRAGNPSLVSGVKLSNVLLSGGRIGVDSVSPGGLVNLQTDGVFWQSYVGLRASANGIQWSLANNYCQTQDWCIDSSPASTLQGFQISKNCWFSGTGSAVWHDVRIPNTFGYTSAVTFDGCLWEGPTGSWMVNSATPVGARNVFGSVASLIFKNNQLADNGTSNVNFLQTLPSTNGAPSSIEFDGGNWTADSKAYLVYTLSNGTSNGIGSLIFQPGLYTGGTGIWGGLTPGIVIVNGGTFSPAISTKNLVNVNDGGIASSRLGTTTNCTSRASPAVCGSASAGSVAIAASSSNVVVDTTAVTANSQIVVTFDSSLGTKLGVTCNTLPQQPYVSARTAGTSFTISVAGTFSTRPGCFSYLILN